MRWGSGAFWVVVVQTSMACASATAVVGVINAVVEQVGVATLSSVVGLQSSSTPLPGYSNAPGLTSAGWAHGPGASQQSPSCTVQPSRSRSGGGITLEEDARPLLLPSVEDVVPALEPGALDDVPREEDDPATDDAPADEDETSSEDAPAEEEAPAEDAGGAEEEEENNDDDDDVPASDDDGAAEDAGLLDGATVDDDEPAADEARDEPAEEPPERELVPPPEEADCVEAELDVVFPDELEELSVVEVPVHPATTRVITRWLRFMVLQAAEACPPTW